MAGDAIDSLSDQERWTKAAGRYQELIGKFTSVGTERLVDLVNDLRPFDSDSYALDNGCGGGSIAISLTKRSSGTKILATDISVGMLAEVDKLQLPLVSTQREDAVTLSGLSDNTFTHVLSSFAIQFTPDCMATVHSMYRVLQPGGIAGIVIWGPYTGPAAIHNEACKRLKPDFTPTATQAPKSWREERDHKAAMEAAGFNEVATETVRLPFAFDKAEGFTEYWFGYGNPVPSKLLAHWQAAGGDLGELKREIEDLVQEEYGNGAEIYFDVVLGVGRKV